MLDDTCALLAAIHDSLVVQRSIDYESTRPACTVTVAAMVHVEPFPAERVTATFDIAVVDVNEPCVILVTTITASQDSPAGTAVALVQLHDPDENQASLSCHF